MENFINKASPMVKGGYENQLFRASDLILAPEPTLKQLPK